MNRRITLINTADRSRHWSVAAYAPSRIVFATFLAVICHSFSGRERNAEEDIERIVIDRTATADEFLELLAHLTPDFAGDVVFIRDGDNGYVSSPGRGAGRVLYALRADDLRFYLETHGLVELAIVAAA